jgi:hypothetical protein
MRICSEWGSICHKQQAGRRSGAAAVPAAAMPALQLPVAARSADNAIKRRITPTKAAPFFVASCWQLPACFFPLSHLDLPRESLPRVASAVPTPKQVPGWYSGRGCGCVTSPLQLGDAVSLISHMPLWVYAPISRPRRIGLLGLLGNPNNTSLYAAYSLASTNHPPPGRGHAQAPAIQARK